jgi:hypothetical protein
LQSDIAANAADNNYLFGFTMAHGPFSDFDQHGKNGLLERKTQIFKG